MKRTTIAFSLATALLLASQALAQVGTSSANGTVKDEDGNPIQGVEVTFTPEGNPSTSYSGKTNKKGKFWVNGMWTPKERDVWLITIEAEGYLLTWVKLESRNAQKVLAGDLEQKIKPNGKIPAMPIKPLGFATVEATMAPEDVVMARHAATGRAVAVAVGGEAAEQKPQQHQKKDPWAQAIDLANSGALEEAIPFFGEAIEAEPEAAERRETYAKILYQLRRYEDAEVEIAAALEMDAARLDARKLLASIQISKGDLGGALENLQIALEQAPEDLAVLERLAYVAGEKGDSEASIGAYEAIVKIDPERTDAWLSLGQLYAEAGRSQDSERALGKVTELDGSNAFQTYYNLGVLILNREQVSSNDARKAADAFSKSVEINPAFAPAWKQLGLARLQIGDPPGAAEALARYVKLEPNAPDAQQFKGLIDTLNK